MYDDAYFARRLTAMDAPFVKHDTCFFERYAQVSLCALLGSEFDCLVNRDRPDLQSRDGRSIGIEVTRAMEESRHAEEELLKDMAGITKGRDDLPQMCIWACCARL